MEQSSLSKMVYIVLVFCAAMTIVSSAQTLNTLVYFRGNNGVNPTAGLVQGIDGNLYGTTFQGGANGGYQGTVFQTTLSGTLTQLHSFAGYPTDGSFPYAGLVQGADGNFYGTTGNGGTSSNCDKGCGTVFELSPNNGNWTFTLLHSFDGNDGSYPEGGLIQATDGNLYGTTFSGGTGNNCVDFQPQGCGTVFKLSPNNGSWTFTLLHSFNFIDGDSPYAGLVQAANGNFYGTTAQGVVTGHICSVGCGTVFEMTPTGTVTTLHTFTGTDGIFPDSALVQATDGNFYGTTSGDGQPAYYGTVFKITPTGTLTTLHSFDGTDGYLPNAPLVQATDGDFYGTTAEGGANQGGTIFKISATGTLITLYNFCAQMYCADGDGPEGGLVQDTNGTFYGTAFSGGAFQAGTVFSLDVGLTPFVKTQPTSGKVGAPVIILGTNLTDSNSVTFNGTAAAFNVVSASEITTTVPAGATTGPVQVTTPSGVLTSTVNFQVITPLQLVPLAPPCRLVDTRKSGGPIQGNTSRDFTVPQLGGCNIPTTAAAYSLNVTVVPPGPLGYLTIWPTGERQPVVSTMNSLDGRIKANAAIVPAGASGAVSVYVSNTTDVVLDIDGYFAPTSGSTLAFYSLTPCRVADTRKSNFPQGLGSPHLSGNVARDFPVLNASTCKIPSSAQAYSLNFTAVPYPAMGNPLGYLELWPTGQQPQNPVSTLNNLTGTIVANAAIVPAGTSGEITAYASNDTDLVIDINGYFAPAGQGGLSLYPAAPCRVIDTRKIGNGQPFSGTLSPPVDVVDSVCGPSNTAQAYVLNATVVPVGALGYLTLWPDGQTQPVVSTLNAIDGAITSNMAIVLTTNGKVDAYASGITQLILDISSYFAP